MNARAVLALSIGLTLLTPGQAKEGFWGSPIVRACCDEGDAFYTDDYDMNGDGSVTVTVTQATDASARWGLHLVGRSFTVPAEKLRLVANPTGRAIIFLAPYKNEQGEHVVLCFIPGPLI
jgi:hypothetical protein